MPWACWFVASIIIEECVWLICIDSPPSIIPSGIIGKAPFYLSRTSSLLGFFSPSNDFDAGDWLLYEVLLTILSGGHILILNGRWIVHVGVLVAASFTGECVISLFSWTKSKYQARCSLTMASWWLWRPKKASFVLMLEDHLRRDHNRNCDSNPQNRRIQI